MKSRLFTLLSALSLALSIVAPCAWLFSYSSALTVGFSLNDLDAPHDHGYLCDQYKLVSSAGSLFFAFDQCEDRNGPWTDDEGVQHGIERTPQPPVTFFAFTWPYNTSFPEAGFSSWRRQFFDFAMGSEAYRGVQAGSDLQYLSVPYWFVCLLLPILPYFEIRRRFARLVPGHCRHCSYNLTGNQSGTCPECGTPISSIATDTRITTKENPFIATDEHR